MSRPSRSAPVDASAPIALTASVIERFQLPPGSTQAFLRDALVPGLKVRVTKTGFKAFIFERKVGQKTTRRAIGSVLVLTIDEAREKAREARLSMDAGTDILGEHKAQARRELSAPAPKTCPVVSEIWTRYIADRKAHWGERHLKDHETLMGAGGKESSRGTGGKGITVPGVLFSLASYKLDTLTPKIVEAWAKKEAATRATQARLGRRLLRAFLNWCKEQEDLEPFLPVGDVVGTKRVKDALGKARAKRDSLMREQLKSWFGEVRALDNRTQSVYLQTLLITGARPNEILDMKWADIDWRWGKLTIRDKVEHSRNIPLTEYLGTQIKSLSRAGEYVFTSTRLPGQKMSSPAKAHRNCCRAARITPVSLQGLRRSFKSLTEWLEIPTGVVAQIQGHKPSATAEKHYTVRPLDLLRVHHQRIESWILEQAAILPADENPKLQHQM